MNGGVYNTNFIFGVLQSGYNGDTARKFAFNPTITESLKIIYRAGNSVFSYNGNRPKNNQFPLLFDFIKESNCISYTNPLNNQVYSLRSYKFNVMFSDAEFKVRNNYNNYKISNTPTSIANKKAFSG